VIAGKHGPGDFLDVVVLKVEEFELVVGVEGWDSAELVSCSLHH
jgi:hypothetical protein